ncbi:MAG TPA: flagellar filament capping protein FliD [Terriglobia bacterium]|nr:flagellar filament capping protein FliD [Terriglobia bacterium]
MGNGTFGLNLNTTGLGLNQGINVQQTVASLVAAAEQPEQPLLTEQQFYSSQQSAVSNINNLLGDLQTAIQALQDPVGALAATAATSSNTNVLTAATTTGATTGTHTVVVNSLATTSSYDTDALASGDTAFGQGQFTLQVGSNSPVTVTVDSSNDTLNTLAAYINSQNDGVSASVVTDANGARLALVSNTTGAPGDLTISGNTTGLTFNKTATGANSSITVDNVPLNTTSNTVTGAIPGVTLNLTGTSASPVTLTVAADTTQTATAINNFVSAYNAVIQAVNTQFTYTQGATQQPPLFSDASLQQVQQQLYTDVNYSISGNSGITSLASLGVSLQSDGTLKADSGALNAALSANPSAVQNLFQQTGGTNGFAINFGNDLLNLTNPATGPLYLDAQGISQNQQSLKDQINDFQARINQQQQLWYKEYAQVNSTLQTLPLLIRQIDAQLGALGGGSSSSSGLPSSSSSSGL